MTKLKKVMDEKSVDCVELAFKSKISYGSIQALRKGSQVNPRVKTAKSIADVFGMTIDELFCELSENQMKL